MKHLTTSTLTWICCAMLSACLPQGGNGRSGNDREDAGGDDVGVDTPDADTTPDVTLPPGDADTPDVNEPHDTGSTADAARGDADVPGKTCPDGSVIPVDQECVCPTSIDDCTDTGGGACTTIMFSSGSPCGTCTITQINQCGPFDGCCPSGCSPDNDDDCAGCGDGLRGPGETCDGNCPRDVNDCPAPPDACSTYSYSGRPETCDAVCTLESTTSRCLGGDGCCPSGCDFDSDSDCDPPPGPAEHGAPCLGAEADCAGRSPNSTCFDSATLQTSNPLTPFNSGGICSPSNCTMPSMTCLDGTTCVDFMSAFPIGTPTPLCLRSCVDVGDCPSGMNCATPDPFGFDPSTYCM